MTSARVVRASAAVALAVALAGGAAVANLRLMESHDRRVEPLSLSTTGSTSPTGSATGPGDGSSSTDTTTTTTAPPSTVLGSTTVPTAATVPGDPPTTIAPTATTTSHAVGDAGTVVLSVQGGTVTVVSVQVTSGWTYLVEKQSGVEVEVELRRGADGAEASFHARLEGGALRVDVGDEDIEGPDD